MIVAFSTRGFGTLMNVYLNKQRRNMIQLEKVGNIVNRNFWSDNVITYLSLITSGLHFMKIYIWNRWYRKTADQLGRRLNLNEEYSQTLVYYYISVGVILDFLKLTLTLFSSFALSNLSACSFRPFGPSLSCCCFTRSFSITDNAAINFWLGSPITCKDKCHIIMWENPCHPNHMKIKAKPYCNWCCTDKIFV